MELKIVGVRALLAAQRRVLHEMRAAYGQLPPGFSPARPLRLFTREKKAVELIWNPFAP
ncbi:MAG TPA: hypothetical protein VFS10_17415 [Pyrinomonadaceae bacterium]|jgi:hypothetical protein|nr:hypothetical protein [Pyrinomonadaceae bacterium]